MKIQLEDRILPHSCISLDLSRLFRCEVTSLRERDAGMTARAVTPLVYRQLVKHARVGAPSGVHQPRFNGSWRFLASCEQPSPSHHPRNCPRDLRPRVASCCDTCDPNAGAKDRQTFISGISAGRSVNTFGWKRKSLNFKPAIFRNHHLILIIRNIVREMPSQR